VGGEAGRTDTTNLAGVRAQVFLESDGASVALDASGVGARVALQAPSREARTVAAAERDAVELILPPPLPLGSFAVTELVLVLVVVVVVVALVVAEFAVLVECTCSGRRWRRGCNWLLLHGRSRRRRRWWLVR
jgi:hypothetical protein